MIGPQSKQHYHPPVEYEDFILSSPTGFTHSPTHCKLTFQATFELGQLLIQLSIKSTLESTSAAFPSSILEKLTECFNSKNCIGEEDFSRSINQILQFGFSLAEHPNCRYQEYDAAIQTEAILRKDIAEFIRMDEKAEDAEKRIALPIHELIGLVWKAGYCFTTNHP